jgi:hypothetical protein
VFSKILEKLMYDRLMTFITKKNILTEAQNGFREKKSNVTAFMPSYKITKRPQMKRQI